MKDVAEALGVTVATVSMALRGDPRISEATRERVRAGAARLGYRPDALVSALMAQRRARGGEGPRAVLAVAALWPPRTDSWERSRFYAPYREGVRARAEALGYAVEVFRADGSEKEGRALARVWRARGIQGVVIAQADPRVNVLPFALDGLAAAYIGNGVREPHLSRVDEALDYDLRLAWRRLRAAGRRRIGFMTWSVLTAKNEGAWMGAYLHAQRELAEEDRLPPLELIDEERHGAIVDWVRRYRPDAVLSERHEHFGWMKGRFPGVEPVGLALTEAEPWAGIRVARREIGAAAVDLVVAQLNRGERGVPEVAKRVLIEGRWQDARAT